MYFTFCYVPSIRVRLLVTAWTNSLHSDLLLVRSHSSLKVIPVVVLVLSIHLVRCRPLLLLPSTFPSIIIFSNPCSARITCPKYESCCLVMMASKERPGLISSNTDLLVLLAVQGILSNLLQIHNSKESIFFLSHFLIVQLSQPYITPGRPLPLLFLSWLTKKYLYPSLSWINRSLQFFLG